MKFSSTLSSSMQRCLLPPILKSMASFSAAPFFWRIAQPSGEDQQNGKQTYCQLPSLSFRITFKDTCFQISVDSYGFYLSSEYLRIFSQTCIAHHGWRKFMVFRLLEYVFVRQKIESNHFCSCPQAKFSPRFLISSTREGEITHFLKATFLWKSISLQQKKDKKRRKLW